MDVDLSAMGQKSRFGEISLLLWFAQRAPGKIGGAIAFRSDATERRQGGGFTSKRRAFVFNLAVSIQMSCPLNTRKDMKRIPWGEKGLFRRSLIGEQNNDPVRAYLSEFSVFSGPSSASFRLRAIRSRTPKHRTKKRAGSLPARLLPEIK